MAEKKKFFDVEVPLLNEKLKLLADNIEQLNNRVIKLDLTRILKGKSLEAVLRVKLMDGKAQAEVFKMTLLSFFIRRMMRKGASYVEESFSAESSDAIVRIKPFLITRKKVHREVRKALRNECRKFLEEYVKDRDIQEIFNEISTNRLQKTLSLKLKKIYPLALCEIRQIYIEKEKQASKKKVQVKAEEAKVEEANQETKEEKVENKTESKKEE